MNLSQTAQMLAQMQAYDQRTVGESDVIAWHAILSDAPFEDCQEAVRLHYAENTDRVMPAHVRRLVRDMARARQIVATATGWAPGQAGVPKAEAIPEISGPIDEAGISPKVRALLEATRAMLPDGSREALMPRRMEWEREYRSHVRVRDAEANPLYRPRADDGGPSFCTCSGLPLGEHLLGAEGCQGS